MWCWGLSANSTCTHRQCDVRLGKERERERVSGLFSLLGYREGGREGRERVSLSSIIFSGLERRGGRGGGERERVSLSLSSCLCLLGSLTD